MENEEWDLLPGPVYVKSFLRTYGDYLGLDGRVLVEEYKRRFERPSDHEPRPISSLHRERERAARGPLLPPWAIIGGVLVAVVIALLLLTNSNTSSDNTPVPPTTSTGTQTANRRTTHRHRTTPAKPVLPSTVRLQLVATSALYVCLVNGAGAKLINEQIFAAGQQIPVETAPKLLLTLGNAGVQMKVNGRPVTVAPSANAIRLLIEPSGVHPIPLSTPPTCP